MQLDIYSFSYLKTDKNLLSLRHGGGFEFDCRALPNPGRQAQFAEQTGLDEAVRLLLSQSDEVSRFLEYALGLVDLSVNNYLSRGFDYLAVGFGCTGGQHRSVYCAQSCAARFAQMGGVQCVVQHCQFETFEWMKKG